METVNNTNNGDEYQNNKNYIQKTLFGKAWHIILTLQKIKIRETIMVINTKSILN